MNIESSEKTIKHILTAERYKIPSFQRAFSWQKPEIEDFLEDVFSSNEDGYFIGSMVMYSDSNYLAIVDGQQRLTTIVLILCAIRDLFTENNHRELASGVQQLLERPNLESVSEFTLQPETSHPYFHDKIMNMNEPQIPETDTLNSEEANIKNGFEQISKYFKGILESIATNPKIKEENKEKEKVEELKSLRNTLLGVQLVLLKLDSRDDAFMVFETLNSRGKDLTVSNLMKNHLAKYLKQENKDLDPLTSTWLDIEESFDKLNIKFEEFLHHQWISTREYTTKNKLYRIATKKINKENAKDYLEELYESAFHYKTIHSPILGNFDLNEKRIEDALYALNIFKIKVPIPTLMASLKAYKNGRITRKCMKAAVSCIEFFHFVDNAITSQRSRSAIQRMYSDYAIKISNCANNNEMGNIINNLKSRLDSEMVSYDEFLLGFQKIVYLDNQPKSKTLVKYILKKFHETKYKTPIALEKMTLEHIFPQSKKGDLENESEAGLIGNLILIPKSLNNDLKDLDFEQKMNILKDNGDPNKDDIFINSVNTWGSEEIIKRTRSMAEEAYKTIWAITPSTGS